MFAYAKRDVHSRTPDGHAAHFECSLRCSCPHDTPCSACVFYLCRCSLQSAQPPSHVVPSRLWVVKMDVRSTIFSGSERIFVHAEISGDSSSKCTQLRRHRRSKWKRADVFARRRRNGWAQLRVHTHQLSRFTSGSPPLCCHKTVCHCLVSRTWSGCILAAPPRTLQAIVTLDSELSCTVSSHRQVLCICLHQNDTRLDSASRVPPILKYLTKRPQGTSS